MTAVKNEPQRNYPNDNKKSSTLTRGESVKAQESWLVRHIGSVRSMMSILFGIFWAIDGFIKFQPGLISGFSAILESSVCRLDSYLVFFELASNGQDISKMSETPPSLRGLIKSQTSPITSLRK